MDALRTLVGCVGCTQVVEEACEVMEPMLMAVLSVRSLRKLELVGDHRQLPAFVQNTWFNLESTHPTIKVSLFERLVTGGDPRHRFNITKVERGGSHQVRESVKLTMVLNQALAMRCTTLAQSLGSVA